MTSIAKHFLKMQRKRNCKFIACTIYQLLHSGISMIFKYYNSLNFLFRESRSYGKGSFEYYFSTDTL